VPFHNIVNVFIMQPAFCHYTHTHTHTHYTNARTHTHTHYTHTRTQTPFTHKPTLMYSACRAYLRDVLPGHVSRQEGLQHKCREVELDLTRGASG